jgi:glycosyltransferase involved in cell wall biosynthesis
LIEHQVTGLVCNPTDSASLARQIEWAVEHSKEAQEIIIRGKNVVIERFDIQQTITNIENYLTHIVKKS